MRPSEALERHREEIRRAVEARGVCNPRVFGSVVRGEDSDRSDLDLLVDRGERTTLLDLAALEDDLRTLLGVRVRCRHHRSPTSPHPQTRARRGSPSLTLDRSELYLDLIREAAENAARFLRGMDKDAFLEDMKTRHAVGMCLIIVGENVARIGAAPSRNS